MTLSLFAARAVRASRLQMEAKLGERLQAHRALLRNDVAALVHAADALAEVDKGVRAFRAAEASALVQCGLVPTSVGARTATHYR
eukprot:2311274-Pyramimonas_sp.AAC.1